MFACCTVEEDKSHVSMDAMALPEPEPAGKVSPAFDEFVIETPEPVAAVAAASPAPVPKVVVDDGTFTVVIEFAGEGKLLGLSLDTTDDKVCVVKGISEGLLQTHNLNCSPDQVVKKSDKMCAVNGSRSDTNELITALEVKDAATLTLVFEHPKDQSVLLKKPGTIGVTLNYKQKSHGLMIRDIHNGLLGDWNKENPDTLIKSGDRIVAVNGVQDGPMGLLEKIRDSETPLLSIMRYK